MRSPVFILVADGPGIVAITDGRHFSFRSCDERLLELLSSEGAVGDELRRMVGPAIEWGRQRTGPCPQGWRIGGVRDLLEAMGEAPEDPYSDPVGDVVGVDLVH